MDAASSERYIKELLKTASPKELGAKLRAHRLHAGLSIRDLARRALLSKTSIVAIEQGRGCRSATLEKVCRALNLHVERLAGSYETSNPVQSTDDIPWYSLDELSSGPISTGPLTDEQRNRLASAGIANPMQMFTNVPADAGFIAGIVEVTHPTEPRFHPGSEFGYVLEGKIRLRVDEQEYEIVAGGAFFVPDSALHSYSNVSKRAKILLFRVT